MNGGSDSLYDSPVGHRFAIQEFDNSTRIRCVMYIRIVHFYTIWIVTKNTIKYGDLILSLYSLPLQSNIHY